MWRSRVSKGMKAHRVLISRLTKYYDPFAALGLQRAEVESLMRSVSADDEFVPDKAGWSQARHASRIRYFADKPCANPIEIDNDCSSGWFGPPIVIDGHHRLCASILKRRRSIAATYGGLVAGLRWLEGKQKKDPFEDY